MTQKENPPMREIRCMAQAAWETVVRSGERKDEDPKDHHSRRNNGAKEGKGGRSRSKGDDDGYRRNGQSGYNEQFAHQEKQSGKEGRSKRHNDRSSSRDSRYWSKEGRPDSVVPPGRLQVDACNLHITSYTQVQAPITQRAWLEVAFQEMKILHPVYISRFDTESLLIGQDLLDRLTPLIDCHHGQLWAQVVAPKSIKMETDARNLWESFPSPSPDPDNPQIEDHNPWPPAHILQDHKAFLCTLGNSSTTLYSPRITGGIQANGVAVQEIIVALWSEKSAVRQDLYDIICQNDANLPFVQKSHRLLSAELPQAPVKSIGVCALTLQIGGREFVHYVSIAPLLSHSFYIGADIIVRLGAQLDMINQVVWSQANIGRNKLTAQPEQMCSGQTVPLACQVAREFDVVIPSRTTGVPLRLMILRGQELDSTQTFFQPSPHLFELNLMVCGSPLLEVANCSVYLLVQNLTHRATQVTARKPLGYLIDSFYHDFELMIPIIGELPNSLREFENGKGVYLTHPTNMITIFPQEPIQSSTVCHVDLGDKVGMVPHTSTMTPNASSSGDAGTLLLEEPYLDFESEVQQQLSRADALKGDAQRQELQGLFYDFKHLFSRDSYDCGVTDLHTPDAHLAEHRHVLNQLSTAGAKLSLTKGQWCQTKVEYAGLLVGANGVEPQSGRVRAIQDIKAPSNLSELRSFLGVCNYSRQFIEDYAEISRPLMELLKKDTDFVWGQTQEQAVQELKRKLCMAPCLAYPDKDREFYMEASFSQHCLSAALSQKHDQDKREVAYASRALSSIELKFSDCEKALLTTVWALEHFRSYIGGQKIIIETYHQPVTFLNSQRLREGRVSNSRIATWMMALQGYEVEVKYAHNHKMALGQGLAEYQHCDSEVQPQEHLTVVTALPFPYRNHHFYDDNVCLNLPKAYVDGCSFHNESQVQAGVGITWENCTVNEPQQYQLGSKTSQYAEIASVLITLQQAARSGITALVICSDSNYAQYSFVSHFPIWKQNGMKNARGKQ
ncbi:hypothetical protein SKAU_G00281500 [Synaphobranchus kaupii]|uniref:RNase H type-1 domain-containing protein n=1 Tax=Synaphobranchus kaupii TaxID=118154 RepID=A0A9Q1IN25_SYNKA|nr:hypothetical protein SKAU_G00281500 [Synaphobranchus kaupii]